MSLDRALYLSKECVESLNDEASLLEKQSLEEPVDANQLSLEVLALCTDTRQVLGDIEVLIASGVEACDDEGEHLVVLQVDHLPGSEVETQLLELAIQQGAGVRWRLN